MNDLILPIGYTKNNDEKPLFDEIDIPELNLINYLQSASTELSCVVNYFENLPESHISRKETKQLYDWTFKPLEVKESNIAVLAGNAGTGKTVVLKDLIELLIQDKIPVLGLKADKKKIDTVSTGKSILGVDADIRSVFDKLTKTNNVVVLLIDQIDALSQSLSTNRQQINAYTALTNQLSQINKVRIIISCRIFDLKHDAELKQYKNKKEIILPPLTDEEVSEVLKKLTGHPISYFPKNLIHLLKTPLHLDVFCKIFNSEISIKKIKTLQDLYFHLWNQKVNEATKKTDLRTEDIQNALYQLADCIEERKENLSIPVVCFNSHYKEIQYLKSENLVTEGNSNLQFFHQSFYDYVYARFFVEKKGGYIYEFLEKEHQGLFIRSKTKQVISYLRDFNPQLYINQLKTIIFADNIRYHIKLMIVEMLAFEEEPRAGEFNLVLGILNYNKNLATSFFNTIPKIKWLHLFIKKKNILLDIINEGKNELENSITRFIVFSANSDVETSIRLLLEITDKAKQGSVIQWTLYRITDFTNPFILEVYHSIEEAYLDDERSKFHILENAIQSNPVFAIEQAKKHFFNEELPTWKKNRKTVTNEDKEFFHFCEELCEKAPIKESYLLFKDVILALINGTEANSWKEYKVLKENYYFMDYEPSTYNDHKYVEWIVDWLKNNTQSDYDFVKKEINEFIKQNEVTLLFIALRVIANDVSCFPAETKLILLNPDLTNDCLRNDDLIYWYRNILEKYYSLVLPPERVELNSYIFNFFSGRDKRPNKEYIKNRKEYGVVKNKFYPYPFLWHSQWILIHSINENDRVDYIELNKHLRFLDERFDGWEYKNKRPVRRGMAMYGAHGLVSVERYKFFNKEQWYQSFLKYSSETHDYDNHKFFSIDKHAEAFRDVIKENPDKYYSFIKGLIEANEIHLIYQINAISGLMEAKYEVSKVRMLFGILVKSDISERHFYSVIHSSKYFIEQSHIDDELISYWKSYALQPFVPSKRQAINDNRIEEDKNDILFNEAWNTPNAEGIQLLVNLSLVESCNQSIFEYLLEISSILPIQLKLIVFYEIATGECEFSKEQLLALFLKYTTEITSEFYHVAGNVINFLLSHYFEELTPFVEQTINIPQAAKSLGAYLLYGWFYGYDKSKELLFELHEKQPHSIKETISQAFRYYHDNQYKEKCKYILDVYINDKRDEVHEAHSHGFYQLEPFDFLSLKEIILQHISKLDDERIDGLYSYLMKCAKSNAKDCLEIQKAINEHGKVKYPYDMRSPIKLITLSYNSIREYNVGDENIEYAMDVFDELLEKNAISCEMDAFLEDVDNL